ncbi:hypothetical protein Leryth_002338 [Lithospermum erythrorhizon]|uniref:Guanyl-nucleotide exchange factor n=1 Tax=Lithospermum erythrorhizon TaxID=34254 RepID=A0AAV3R218_LITER|nr:hypothetical protein Leryth_002338 [Lithospermum erythrorhizon]
MEKNEEVSSPSWSASLFMQTTEDVAKAVAAAAAAVHTARPSVVYSEKDDSGGQIKKLQRHVSKLLKGFSSPSQVKSGLYNPEILTSQKRQWASIQLQNHRVWKEPSRLFESMVVVGLHPECDIQTVKNLYFGKKSEGSGRFRGSLNGSHQSRVEPNLEPQVLFVYPPEKQLPLKSKDLLSFCFPGGIEVHTVEKTPSMSELTEILLGQEHFKQSDLSFVFRLQVADDSTLYGCCVLVEELLQKPSSLISMISDGEPFRSGLGRHIFTTRRCYCILSRIPCFELHFSVLNSIFIEERLERLTKQINDLDLELPNGFDNASLENESADMVNVMGTYQSSIYDEPSGSDDVCGLENQSLDGDNSSSTENFKIRPILQLDAETLKLPGGRDSLHETQSSSTSDMSLDVNLSMKQPPEKRVPHAVLPFLRYQQCESSESSSSFQGSPCEDRHFRSDVDESETDEASFSGQDDSSEHNDILEWAKANKHGSLQIICQYYQLQCPARGSTIKFHPLEHLHPLEYHRPDEVVMRVTGAAIDLRSCSTSLELAEAHAALMVEEEASSLSVWAVACLCGSLRLEHILTLFSAALLEKQIVMVCSNLGILSASVLSIIPLIRPYRWQSLLMPILPNDMLDFLDAPVPYVVGVKNKTMEAQSKLTNVILVDVNKNQVKSPTIPFLPRQRDLYHRLMPFHAKLVGESYLGKKRPVYECTDVQVEAAKGFLSVLRSYLDSLCSNLRSHTITNVQSNNDKVSLLLKDSFIESYQNRDRPFMKLFVDTQLFSVHTDFVLSFFQKE